MNEIFGCGGDWRLHCFESIREVKVIKSGETFSFQFPWQQHKDIQVCLESYDKKEKKISGTFEVIDGELSGEIDFEVRQKNRLAGMPDKFHNSTWTLYRG